MASDSSYSFFNSVLQRHIGGAVSVQKVEPKSGGCISNAAKLETSEGPFFIKWNSSFPSYMFESEAKGLKLLQETKSITIPSVFGWGKNGQVSYILMENVDVGLKNKKYFQNFAVSLANMHRNSNEKYGLAFDNFMGSLEQYNEPTNDWINFFIQKRLKVQLGLLEKKGIRLADLKDKFDKFYKKLPELLISEPPALVHGDLWSGNLIVGPDGEACLIDPAVYYGHREVDIAMTQLFGGFDADFYESYNDVFPLEPGYQERLDIYNLYPLLVHVNLFGLSYMPSVERVIKKYQ